MADSWRPRSSSLGYYTRCTARALFDLALAEGLLDAELEAAQEERGPAPYAAHGTICHFIMQDGMRCQFPGDPSDFAPTEEEYEDAATLFDGDTDFQQMMARKVATTALTAMPEAPDGKPWLAESAWETPYLTGHIDFLSQDFKHIVDLKTTARKPVGNRAKSVHVVQLYAYRYLVAALTGVFAERATVLYADSIRAKWALPVDIDFTTPEAEQFYEFVSSFIEFINNRDLLTAAAMPSFTSCSDDFCPHTAICRARYMNHTGEAIGTDAEYAMPTAMGSL